MSQIIEDAKSVGAVEHEFSDRITFDFKQLQAFVDLQLAKNYSEKDSCIHMMDIRIEQLEAKVAMQAEALCKITKSHIRLLGIIDEHEIHNIPEQVLEVREALSALNATSADIEAYRNRIKAEVLREIACYNHTTDVLHIRRDVLLEKAKQLEGVK